MFVEKTLKKLLDWAHILLKKKSIANNLYYCATESYKRYLFGKLRGENYTQMLDSIKLGNVI